MPSSMNKHGCNISKPSFGCCFCREFVNLKKLMVVFWNTCVIYDLEKVVPFLIQNVLKVIRNLRSRIAIPVSIIDVYQIKNQINLRIS